GSFGGQLLPATHQFSKEVLLQPSRAPRVRVVPLQREQEKNSLPKIPSGWNDAVPRFGVQLASIREAVPEMIAYVLGLLMALLVARKNQPHPCFNIKESIQIHPPILIKTPLSPQLVGGDAFD